jgi:biopolymer transport protein ExbB
MSLDTQVMHEIIFYVLYAAAALATFVIAERFIFYWITLRDARRLEAVFDHHVASLSEIPNQLCDSQSLSVQVVRDTLATKGQLAGRSDLEDLTQSLFIAARAKLARHIWILDTVVTAAPLLGLLGTILGIIDTFSALAQAGVSDPAAVSKGIGTALYATAMGIAVALYGLFFHNLFQIRIDAISDHLKVLLLRAGMDPRQNETDVSAPDDEGTTVTPRRDNGLSLSGQTA